MLTDLFMTETAGPGGNQLIIRWIAEAGRHRKAPQTIRIVSVGLKEKEGERDLFARFLQIDPLERSSALASLRGLLSLADRLRLTSRMQSFSSPTEPVRIQTAEKPVEAARLRSKSAGAAHGQIALF